MNRVNSHICIIHEFSLESALILNLIKFRIYAYQGSKTYVDLASGHIENIYEAKPNQA